MPVQYSGTIAEHNAVRNQAGLFDLGHMVRQMSPVRTRWGASRPPRRMTSAHCSPARRSTDVPNERGGVIDDILIYRRPEGDGYMVVVNASNRFRDVDWMHEQRRNGASSTFGRDISDETGPSRSRDRTRHNCAVDLRPTTSRILPITTGVRERSPEAPVMSLAPVTPARRGSRSTARSIRPARSGMR